MKILLVRLRPNRRFPLVRIAVIAALLVTSCNRPTAQDSYQQGIQFRDTGQIVKAQNAFEEAIKRNPRYSPPYRALAEMAFTAQAYRASAGLWSAYLDREPEAEHGWCNLAQAEMMDGPGNAALDHAQKELTLAPECSRAHLCVGWLYSQLDRPQEALPHLVKAANDFRADARFQLTYGKTLALTGKYPDAESALTPLLKIAPNEPEPLYWLGYVYARRSASPDDARKAETYLRRAVDVGKSQTPANYELGRLLVRLKRYPEAILPLRRAAIADLNDPAPLAALSQAHAALNQKADAKDARDEFQKRAAAEKKRQSLLRSYAANPKDVTACLELGKLELQRGDVNRAVWYLESARTLAPENADIQKLYEETKKRLLLSSDTAR